MVFLKSSPNIRMWWVGAAILVLLLILNPAVVAQQVPARKHPVKAAKKIVPDPPAPVQPPPPPTLEQMPALPPQVRYTGGQLTIVAENSTLGDILRAVQGQTGANIEVPPNATERVAAHFGPGSPRDVLTTLLNGSHFNYVMVGSPGHPADVDRLILTSKSDASPDSSPAAPVAQGNSQGEDGTQGVDISEQPVDNGEVPQPQPNMQQVKTPEQLLRELQQQQQQQQQPQSAPPGAPHLEAGQTIRSLKSGFSRRWLDSGWVPARRQVCACVSGRRRRKECRLRRRKPRESPPV